jgi:hypothetical protein
MFNLFKKPKYRIMQNQATKKYYIQKKYFEVWETLQENAQSTNLKFNKCFPEKIHDFFENIIGDTIYFDTLEQAEAKIAEFKAEEEKKELLKNPKIIKYL